MTAPTETPAEIFAAYTRWVARLSPLGFAHITILGRYQFTVPESVQRGDYRPLRDPGTAEAEAAGEASTGFPFR